MARNFEFVTKCSEFPREGFILSKDKLYEVNKEVIYRCFDMPGENIDENISYCMDSSGMLGTIPACCVPADATIYVDCHNLFDANMQPTEWYKTKKCCFVPAIIAVSVGAAMGVILYRILKK